MSNIGVPIKEEHKAILLNGAKAAGEKTVQSFMLNAALDKAESLRLPQQGSGGTWGMHGFGEDDSGLSQVRT